MNPALPNGGVGYRLMRRLLCLALWSGLLVPGCAVGPDFVRPQPPAATQYTQGKEPTATVSADGQAQHFDSGAKIAADWWQLFQISPSWTP